MTSHGPQIPTHNDPQSGELRMTYCPGRDFINIYPLMLHQLAVNFDAGRWDSRVEQLAAKLGCNFDEAYAQLKRVMESQVQFVNLSCEDPEEGLSRVLTRAGWFALPAEARDAYLAAIGEMVQGQIFAGIRDVSLAGESPPRHWQRVLVKYWDLGLTTASAVEQLEEQLRSARRRGVSLWRMPWIICRALLGS